MRTIYHYHNLAMTHNVQCLLRQFTGQSFQLLHKSIQAVTLAHWLHPINHTHCPVENRTKENFRVVTLDAVD